MPTVVILSGQWGKSNRDEGGRGLGLTDLWGRKRAKVTVEAKMFKECLRV